MTTPPATIPAAPKRLTPVDILAREAYEAMVVLGPVVCFEDIARVCRSRPALVRAAMDRLLDIGLVVPHPSGCYSLPMAQPEAVPA